MKKVLTIVLFCCVGAALSAQNWLGVSVDGNLAWQLDRIAITSAKTGGGIGLDMRYQLQANHFTIETGLGAAYTMNPVGIKDTTLHYTMKDDRGRNFTYNGQLKNRKDISRSLSLNIPLLLGVEYHSFYALAGATASINVFGRTCQTALLATSGEYNMYYEPLVNMPGHGFHDFEQQESRGTMSYNLDLRVSAEAGAVFYSKNGYMKYRLGLYVAYGVFDVRQFDSRPLLVPDFTESLHFEMNHIYSSSYEGSSPVNNLLCGIRFTFMVNLSPGPANRYMHY